jgi:hypothetical protein
LPLSLALPVPLAVASSGSKTVKRRNKEFKHLNNNKKDLKNLRSK